MGGAVASIQAPKARLMQDRRHRRGRHTDDIGDPPSAPVPVPHQARKRKARPP